VVLGSQVLKGWPGKIGFVGFFKEAVRRFEACAGLPAGEERLG
jgi:hypothetical protein